MFACCFSVRLCLYRVWAVEGLFFFLCDFAGPVKHLEGRPSSPEMKRRCCSRSSKKKKVFAFPFFVVSFGSESLWSVFPVSSFRFVSRFFVRGQFITDFSFFELCFITFIVDCQCDLLGANRFVFVVYLISLLFCFRDSFCHQSDAFPSSCLLLHLR